MATALSGAFEPNWRSVRPLQFLTLVGGHPSPMEARLQAPITLSRKPIGTSEDAAALLISPLSWQAGHGFIAAAPSLCWPDQPREPICWNAHHALACLNIVDQHGTLPDRVPASRRDIFHSACRRTIRHGDVSANFCNLLHDFLQPSDLAGPSTYSQTKARFLLGVEPSASEAATPTPTRRCPS